MASPSSWNSTASWISACVPTTSWAAPLATACCAPRLAAAVRRPTSHATLTSSGASHCAILRKCCSARISVGAISATWKPHSIARAAASAAITVLPLPTSPCTRRCIGRAPARSRSTSIQHAVLRAREPERQRVAQLRREFARARQRVRASLLARVARRAQRDLLRQQFVELQALPGRIGALGQRVRVGIGRRVMQAPDRRLQRGQAELVEQRAPAAPRRCRRRAARGRCACAARPAARPRAPGRSASAPSAAQRPPRARARADGPFPRRPGRRARRRTRARAVRPRTASAATGRSAGSAAPVRRCRRAR